MPNPFQHFELFATDYDRAKNFYETMFGWEFNFFPEFNYALISTGGIPGGGIAVIKNQDDCKTGMSITVQNMAELLEKVRELGGEVIIERTQLGGNNGWYAAFKDLSGNTIGMWSEK